jgi:hypothetical protein
VIVFKGASGMKLPRLMVAILIACAASATAGAQERKFSERLLAAPFDTAMRPHVQGDGRVEVTLNGRMAKVTGSFNGLSAPATKVRLFRGPGPAIPGEPMADLTFTPGPTGAFNGSLRLTAAQATDLINQKLYVRIDTEKAPEGALIGWLMPARAFPGEGVPEYGPAYAP